jgi:hypothetical protein
MHVQSTRLLAIKGNGTYEFHCSYRVKTPFQNSDTLPLFVRYWFVAISLCEFAVATEYLKKNLTQYLHLSPETFSQQPACCIRHKRIHA